MATVTITINATSTVQRSKTVSGADLLRFAAALRVTLGMPGAADDAVLLAWMDRVFADAKNTVRSVEQTSAATAAAGSVTDVTFS